MSAGSFGPFEEAELTGLLAGEVSGTQRRIASATLHDVQFRAGHYYGIAEAVVHHDGGVGQTYFGMTTAPVPPTSQGQTTNHGRYQVFVWEHPLDPLLPGLGLAATPAKVQRYFAPQRELASLQTIIYRPMNRAVFRAHLAPQQPAGLGDTIYLKVLRRNAATALYNIHLSLAAAGVPVVAPIAEPVADVLALAGGQGIPLGELVRTEGVHNQFDPRRLIGILDRFPHQVIDYPHRPSWADRHQEFIYSARQAMPADDERIAHLGYQLEHAHEGLELGPLVPTHGDLYEAHILVHQGTGRIQQILDVDGAGPGFRVDDYACLIGHLAVLGQTEQQHWGWQTAMRFFNQLAPYTNPYALAVRSAAMVVSLIPGHQPDAESQARGRAYLHIAETLLAMA
ncbi:MAG: aminoglycoside phosphotransferase family protein [Yaniella sp.]|nr:aminoglycoside phosphotransferase family protein [Yaniella sp.]